MTLEPIEQRLKQFQQNQALILDRVDNAIALFNAANCLVLFNPKFAQLWEFSTDWLQQKPHAQQVFESCVAKGYWSSDQAQELLAALLSESSESRSFSIEQQNRVCLEVEVTATSDGGQLLSFRDITGYQQSQASLNREVQRLIFLLGLTERLQPAEDLQEIGKFALSYLVETLGAAFGDVKVIAGEGEDRTAGLLSNEISSQFIATYGEVAVAGMEALLQKGIPYGQGLLWQVVETGEPLFASDYHSHPQAVEEFRHPGIGQLGIFPIPGAKGNIIGVLTLESRSERNLQDSPQQDMVLAACRTLGVAIERAQAEAELRQANESLERASRMAVQILDDESC